MSKPRSALFRVVFEALHTSFELFKIILPIVFLTKLLTDYGVTTWLGKVLSPVMAIVGLPGETALVWATAMMTNLYGGLAVFAGLSSSATLTVAQVSVLTTMMLVAHALPVELRIAQKAGSRFAVMAMVRTGGALLLGFLLHRGYACLGVLQQAHGGLWKPSPVSPGWAGWLLDQAENLLLIFAIILLLLALMRLLEHFGLMVWLTRGLKPFLSILGIHQDAAAVTLIGMLLGLSYGGGLIIREAQRGRLPARDIFLALLLMGLCHSLIEDTLLMAMAGGHWSAILGGRLLFSIAVVVGFALLIRLLPATVSSRFFYRSSVSSRQ